MTVISIFGVLCEFQSLCGIFCCWWYQSTCCWYYWIQFLDFCPCPYFLLPSCWTLQVSVHIKQRLQLKVIPLLRQSASSMMSLSTKTQHCLSFWHTKPGIFCSIRIQVLRPTDLLAIWYLLDSRTHAGITQALTLCILQGHLVVQSTMSKSICSPMKTKIRFLVTNYLLLVSSIIWSCILSTSTGLKVRALSLVHSPNRPFAATYTPQCLGNLLQCRMVSYWCSHTRNIRQDSCDVCGIARWRLSLSCAGVYVLHPTRMGWEATYSEISQESKVWPWQLVPSLSSTNCCWLHRGGSPLCEVARYLLTLHCWLMLFYRCEHYSQRSRHHLLNFQVGNGLYDEHYLAALLTDNWPVIHKIEGQVQQQGYGPLAPCHTIRNFSTMCVNCGELFSVSSHILYCSDIPHHSANGSMVMMEMETSKCTCKFAIYTPQKQYCDKCPWILIVWHSPHNHPPPTPTKTPFAIITAILDLLSSFDCELPDMTTLTFLQHPASAAFLRTRLLHLELPTFTDLHPSLANTDHLGWYGKVQYKVSRPRAKQVMVGLSISAFFYVWFTFPQNGLLTRLMHDLFFLVSVNILALSPLTFGRQGMIQRMLWSQDTKMLTGLVFIALW